MTINFASPRCWIPLTQQLTALSKEFKTIFDRKQESAESVVGPLRQELEGLRIVVGEALGDRTRKRVESLPGDLAREYEALIMEGVQPQLAHDLLRSVAETLGTAGLTDQRVVKDLLRERMEDSISVSSSICTDRKPPEDRDVSWANRSRENHDHREISQFGSPGGEAL